MPPILIICISIAAAILLVFLLYICLFVRPRVKKTVDEALLCSYAHRGLHGGDIPENSLAAFERACLRGYGIELDVQLSRDGVVTVFHDYTLTRMTGREARLCELDSEELSSLSLGGTGEHIPTFSEVLSLVAGRVPILVELKGETTSTELCAKVAEELKAYGGKYCIESFNPLLVREIQKHLPNAFCGLLYTNVCRDKRSFTPLNLLLTLMAFNFLARPAFIAYRANLRKSFPVRLATGLYRAPRFVWTVRDAAGLDTALSLGECPIFEEK